MLAPSLAVTDGPKRSRASDRVAVKSSSHCSRGRLSSREEPNRTSTFERYQCASIRSRSTPGSVRASTRSRTSRTSSKYEAVSGCTEALLPSACAIQW